MALLICSNIPVIDSFIAVIALAHNPQIDTASAASTKTDKIFHNPPNQSAQKSGELAGFVGLVCTTRNHFIKLFGERLFVQLQIANIKIPTTFINTHLPTGNRRINQPTQQVHRRVHLHVLVEARPVQLECDRRAEWWQRLNRRDSSILDAKF